MLIWECRQCVRYDDEAPKRKTANAFLWVMAIGIWSIAMALWGVN